MLDDKYKTDKKGKQHFDNEAMSGVSLRLYHLPDKDGKTNLFGVEVVLPEKMRETLDFEMAERERGSVTCGSLLEVVATLCKQVQLHPCCHEVTGFDGSKVDCSNIGLEDLIKSVMGEEGIIERAESAAREQYESEKKRGVIPDGLKFEDWLEFATPDPKAIKH